MSRTFAVVLALSLLIFGICLLRYAPPTLRDAQIPADQFSGARAQEVQKVISGGGSRVIGSDANAAARTFLVAELNKDLTNIPTAQLDKHFEEILAA